MDTGCLPKEAVEAATAATYKARWVDGVKDARLATDEEIAKAVLGAAQPQSLTLATMLLEQEAIPAARAAELEALAEILHDEVNSFARVRNEGVTPVHELNRFRRVLTERAAAIRAGGA